MTHRFPARPPLQALALALSLAACADAPTAASPAAAPSASAVKFWEVGSSVYWNGVARELLPTHPRGFDPAVQARILTYLSIAQHNAVVTAETTKERGRHASPAAAAAGASLVVLKSFLPAAAHPTLDARLQAQLAGPRWPGEQQRDVDAGLAVGEAIGAEVAAYAAGDGFGLAVPPPNPGGPGTWTGTNPYIGLHGTRLLALESPDQFRPAPPPAFGSAEFEAALADLRAVVQHRTEEQIRIARYWATRNSDAMNAVAARLIVEHRRTERDAARILALANIAGFDVVPACFDAKFAYYFIRPTQADREGITIVQGLFLPPHPSYPSAHSCITAAFVTVLASAFPSERAELEAIMEEAGLSRMYAGIHYRFDLVAGQELGRQVARWVLEHGVDRRAPIPLD